MRSFMSTHSKVRRPPTPTPFEAFVIRWCLYKKPPLIRGPLSACVCALALLLSLVGFFVMFARAASVGARPFNGDGPRSPTDVPEIGDARGASSGSGYPPPGLQAGWPGAGAPARAAGARPPAATTLNLSSVYVLDPHSLLMFNRCKHLLHSSQPPQLFQRAAGASAGHSSSHRTHSADYYFMRAVSKASFRRRTAHSPRGASLVVVPIACSQSFYGQCGDGQTNLAQLRARLASLFSLPVFASAVNATVIVCDDPAARAQAEQILPPGIVFGSVEAWRQPFSPGTDGMPPDYVATGHTTNVAGGACAPRHEPPLAQAERSLQVFSAMQTSPSDPSYALRRRLWCDAVLHPQPGLLLTSKQRSCTGAAAAAEGAVLRPVRACAADSAAATARFVLSLAGESPTTQRIATALEVGSVPLVHSDEWPAVSACSPHQFNHPHTSGRMGRRLPIRIPCAMPNARLKGRLTPSSCNRWEKEQPYRAP